MENKAKNTSQDSQGAKTKVSDQRRQGLNPGFQQFTEIREAVEAAREKILELRQKSSYLDFLIKKHNLGAK